MKIKIGDSLVLDMSDTLRYLEREFSSPETTRTDYFEQDLTLYLNNAVISLNPKTEERVDRLENHIEHAIKSLQLILDDK